MKKKPPARAPLAIPELHVCPGCGLGMQRGRGPHRLAWHECRPVEPVQTAEELEAVVIQRLAQGVRDGSIAPDRALAALRARGGSGGGKKAVAATEDAPAATTPSERLTRFLAAVPR